MPIRRLIPVATSTAMLCTTAGAQSSVTLYGLLDLAAASFKGESTGVKASDGRVKAVINGGLTTSHWGIRGSEDLGSGFSAIFDLSSFIRADTGQAGRADAIGAPVNVAADPFFSRVAHLGLRSSSWGSMRVGNISTPLFINSISSNAFGDSMVFSPTQLTTFVGSPLTGGTAWTNSVIYESPRWNGAYLALMGSLAETQGGRNSGGRIGYARGDFATSVAWQNVKKNPLTFADGLSSNNTTAWQWAGAYDFKYVKLFAHLSGIQNNGTEAAPLDVFYRVWDVSASIPIGTGNVLAGYAARKTTDAVGLVPNTVSGGNVERRVFSLAYDLYLSKRTDAYLLYSQDETVTNTLPAPGNPVVAKGSAFAVGMRHRF